jgi:ubiquinone/menaquinone biosynthesis C-methylase UbiE
MKVIRKAEIWSKKLRKNYDQPWMNRKQDYAYKKYVEHPTITSLLKNMIPAFSDGTYLDIGCGDGHETFLFQKRLLKRGDSGIFYAFDPEQNQIAIAQRKNRPNNRLPIIFDCGYLDKLSKKYQLFEKVNLVFSTFVLQDLPNIKIFIESIQRVMKKEAFAIFSLVHPAFAKNLLKKEALKIALSGQAGFWRWAAAYPIVEEEQKTFFVPYFHRTIEDYLEIFNSIFRSVICKEAAPSKRNITICQNKSISPFYSHPGNVYFPEIIEMPSSLFLIAQK